MFEKEEREKVDSSAFPKYLNSQHYDHRLERYAVWNLYGTSESHFAIVLDDNAKICRF